MGWMELRHESQHSMLWARAVQAAEEFETRIRLAAVDDRERGRMAVPASRGIRQAKLGVNRDLESSASQQARKSLLRDGMLAEEKCLASAALEGGAVMG